MVYLIPFLSYLADSEILAARPSDAENMTCYRKMARGVVGEGEEHRLHFSYATGCYLNAIHHTSYRLSLCN